MTEFILGGFAICIIYLIIENYKLHVIVYKLEQQINMYFEMDDTE